ncbi:MAG: 3-methyl-2-oxobutanoate hydroxymethyltransferase [Romboutsia sp.]|nr:3-methyl-2-oxobutanoate hydroxymethyltransferase [Romboutsia sp.]
MKITDFKKYKDANNKITMVTCYDYTSAKITQLSNIDCILVGDSIGMVMHGEQSTINTKLVDIIASVKAVRKGCNKFIVGDLPFLSYRKSLETTMNAVEKIMQAGANAVKLEGVTGHEDYIKHIVQSGIPVMGHIGLTPQSVHQLGGYKIQGRDQRTADLLLEQAKTLTTLGCFAIVLECVPNPLAKKITEAINIPTIGIGAGVEVDGQVLVWQDLLGLNLDFKPKFVKNYLNGAELVKTALNNFNQEVKTLDFPNTDFSFE